MVEVPVVSGAPYAGLLIWRLSLDGAVQLTVGEGGLGIDDTVEEAGAQVEDGLLLAVRRPGEAETRAGVANGSGIVLHGPAQAEGELQAGAKLPLVLSVEDGLQLVERDGRCAGCDVELGGRAAGKVEQSAAVLFEAGDGGGAAGAVERGSGTAAEDVGAVEACRLGVVERGVEELEAGLEVVFAAGVHDVVIDFEVALVGAEIAGCDTAAGKGAPDLERRGGGDGCVGAVAPGVADAGLVDEGGGEGLQVGSLHDLLRLIGVVTGFGEDVAADALIRELVDVGGVGGGEVVLRAE